MTGSRFGLDLQARLPEEQSRLAVARLRAVDGDVLHVVDALGASPGADGGLAEGTPDAAPSGADAPDGLDEEVDFSGRYLVEVIGPGETELFVEDDEGLIDRLVVRAADADTLHLIDGVLLGTAIDGRLPARFALRLSDPAEFAIAAEDRCGGPLLALDAALLAVPPALEEGAEAEASLSAPPLTWVRQTALSFAVTPAREGQSELRLVPRVGDEVRYRVDVVPDAAADEVRVEVASAEGNQATLWGRAFATDIEVIGMAYGWTATERVGLSTALGPIAVATLSFSDADAAPDERPAVVTATLEDATAELNLLTVRVADLNARRVASDVTSSRAAAASCVGDRCDPVQAAWALALWAFGRRRQRLLGCLGGHA